MQVRLRRVLLHRGYRRFFGNKRMVSRKTVIVKICIIINVENVSEYLYSQKFAKTDRE